MENKNEYDNESHGNELDEKTDKRSKKRSAKGKNLRLELEKKLEVYLERRKEKLTQNDVVFTESLTPEEKRAGISHKNSCGIEVIDEESEHRSYK